MFDLRPVFHVIGLLVAALGLTMLFPLAVDLWYGEEDWFVFVEAAIITTLIGALTALATDNATSERLTIQQTFLLTTSVWLALPVFGAIPFWIGVDGITATDAFFEAMSGLTTTGATIFDELGTLSQGLLMWRAVLQWLGGIGIIVVAMVFLPELRVGGMQIFRSEGFDTFGKILPRATEISSRISVIYAGLTLACMLGYLAAGMDVFDATAHAMTTLATGGFSTKDASFADAGAAAEYVAIVFMALAALPFVRYVQLLSGTAEPLWRDSQIRAFFVTLAVAGLILAVLLCVKSGQVTEQAFRKALFPLPSLVTGTGYASADYMQWGGFAITFLFFIGLIGGCAGSTSCSIKVFRYQLLFASVVTQMRRIQSPSGIFTPKYEGRPVSEDVGNSVMSFFVFFVLTLGVLAILLSLTGLDVITSVSGAAAALANIGPGLGDTIGPTGTYADINTPAKWLLIVAMLIGRLELLAVYAILTRTFWRS